MTETIQSALDSAFTALGVAATYTPSGGEGVSVTVMPFQETDEIGGLGAQGHVAPEHYFDIRADEVAAPAIGATLAVGGVTYTIRERRHRDARQLVWRVLGEPS